MPASMSPPVQAVRSDPRQRATRQLAAAVVAAGWLTGWAGRGRPAAHRAGLAGRRPDRPASGRAVGTCEIGQTTPARHPRPGRPGRAAYQARRHQPAAAADHRRADQPVGHEGHPGGSQGRGAARDDAPDHGEPGRGRRRPPRQGDPRPWRARGGQDLGGGGGGAGGRPGGDAAAGAVDHGRGVGRAELHPDLPATGQAAVPGRHPARQRPTPGQSRPGAGEQRRITPAATAVEAGSPASPDAGRPSAGRYSRARRGRRPSWSSRVRRRWTATSAPRRS